MSIQNVEAAIASVVQNRNTGGFVALSDINAIKAAAGKRLGRQERAKINNFMLDVIEHRGGLEPMSGVKDAIDAWRNSNPMPGGLEKPGDLQAHMAASGLETAARARKAGLIAGAWKIGTPILVATATYAGYGLIAGSWTGPGALAAAGIGAGVGFIVGSVAAAWSQLSQASNIFNERQGTNASDPYDLE